LAGVTLSDDGEVPDFAMATLLKAKLEVRPLAKILGKMYEGVRSKQRTYEALDGGVNLLFQAFIQPWLHAIHSRGDELRPNTVGFNFDTRGGAEVLLAWLEFPLEEDAVASIDMGDDSVIKTSDGLIALDRNSSEYQIVHEDLDVLEDVMIDHVRATGACDPYIMLIRIWLYVAKNRILVIGNNRYFETGRLPSGILGTTELTEMCIKMSLFGAIVPEMEPKRVNHKGFDFWILAQKDSAFTTPLNTKTIMDIADDQNSVKYGFSWKTATVYDLADPEDVEFLSRKLYFVTFEEKQTPLFNLSLERALAIGICGDSSGSLEHKGVANIMISFATLFWLAPWPFMYNVYASYTLMQLKSMSDADRQLLLELVNEEDYGELTEFAKFSMSKSRPPNWAECISLRTSNQVRELSGPASIDCPGGNSRSWVPPSTVMSGKMITDLKSMKPSLKTRAPRGTGSQPKTEKPKVSSSTSSVSKGGGEGSKAGKARLPPPLSGGKGKGKAAVSFPPPVFPQKGVKPAELIRAELQEADNQDAKEAMQLKKEQEEKFQAGRDAMTAETKAKKEASAKVVKSKLAGKGKKKKQALPTLTQEELVAYVWEQERDNPVDVSATQFLKSHLKDLKVSYKVPKDTVGWVKEALATLATFKANVRAEEEAESETSSGSDELSLEDLDDE
jgi:hypothetical protein